jgi:multiple sugar transport system permease protein
LSSISTVGERTAQSALVVRSRARAWAGKIALFTLLAAISILTVFPLLWMLSSAFKTRKEAYLLTLWPDHPTFANFRYVFSEVPFPRYLFKCFFVSSTV